MDSTIIVIILACLLAMSLPLIIILIAYLAARSRKKKQAQLLQKIGPTDYAVAVRYNMGSNQDQILKLKAFQGSGILYVKGEKIFFEDTLHRHNHMFFLKNCEIRWVDINIVNGLLKWFSIEDSSGKYYFNIETGMFIWQTGTNKPTTLSVFRHLQKLRDEYKYHTDA